MAKRIPKSSPYDLADDGLDLITGRLDGRLPDEDAKRLAARFVARRSPSDLVSDWFDALALTEMS